LGLSLLQGGLGCALSALGFATLWLSPAGQVKNAWSAWAGLAAILCGILGLMTWKKPVMTLTKLSILLSIISVLLSLTGFILACQGIQFLSKAPSCNLMDKNENKVCFCCEELQLNKCTDVETALKLYFVKSCSAAHLILKKILLGLCVLNALTAAVSLTVTSLHYLQILTSRRFCLDESQIEENDQIFDTDDFVPPVPPPSYFATFNSGSLQMSHRTFVSDGLSLPHVYATRLNGVEVFFRLDPPPPYEDDVQSSNVSEQGDAPQINVMKDVDSGELSEGQASEAEETLESSSRASLSPSNASCRSDGVNRRALSPLQKRSKSDPVLLCCHLSQGTALSCETATRNEVKQQLHVVIVQECSRARALRGKPQYLIDLSYTDTKWLVAWILEQSSCSMSPDIHELVENIKCVLKSDEKHMAETITSATFLEQVMAPAQEVMSSRVHVLPFRRQPELLYLDSCDDLTTSTTDEDQLA
ncbi:F1892 protein, partial [Campylorhamphus procurvoides]|nr:F1892 protein [Campylorhamphus procurvoides]